MSIFDNLTGQGDVLFIGLGRGIDHDGSETAVDAALAELEAVAVVQMQSDRDFGVFNHSSLNQLHQVGVVGIGAGALGYLQDDGSLQLACGFGNALNDFHVVDVERADSVTAVVSLLKHFGCGNKCHSKETSLSSLMVRL